ncbi:hypothetical protein EK21DRAFT_105548 [Setomelanomma holmii]|uniref:Uncharacterized protein n=1 Tax=Setomelanomma holmii TaxID=210430 RepID=A0A9P4GW70_9PLEO|nr:hypothetical protein EK21DRAFT_105548 [Setomelanomma holmii]
MNSQDTIEDPTLYQDMFTANDSDESTGAAEIENSPHSVRSASHSSQSAPECKKDAQDDRVDKGLMKGRPCRTADSYPHAELERVLLSVTQLDSHLTQLQEGVEEAANSIKYVIKSLEELKDDLRNDVGKTKDQTQRCRQRRILK